MYIVLCWKNFFGLVRNVLLHGYLSLPFQNASGVMKSRIPENFVWEKCWKEFMETFVLLCHCRNNLKHNRNGIIVFWQMWRKFLQKLLYFTNFAKTMTQMFCSSSVEPLWFPYHWVSNLPANLPASYSLFYYFTQRLFPCHSVLWLLQYDDILKEYDILSSMCVWNVKKTRLPVHVTRRGEL